MFFRDDEILKEIERVCCGEPKQELLSEPAEKKARETEKAINKNPLVQLFLYLTFKNLSI